jgi:hypothetical protein
VGDLKGSEINSILGVKQLLVKAESRCAQSRGQKWGVKVRELWFLTGAVLPSREHHGHSSGHFVFHVKMPEEPKLST